MIFTKEQFIICYNGLSQQATKEQANDYTMKLGESNEAWEISRELLNDTNSTHKFLGAQMLHNKTRNSYEELTAQQKDQLTTFVFSLLFEVCSTASKAVISKLAGICAIIITHASQNVTNLDNFLRQLSEAMQMSISHLRAGLDVLQEIPDQCKEMKSKTFNEKKIIKNIILEKVPHLVSLFISVFDTNDDSSITKNLQTLVSWADFGLPIMEHPPLVTQILRNSTKSIENLDFTTQIFGFTFKYHFFKDSEVVETVTLTKHELSENYLANLVLIVQFILQSSKYIFDQMNSQHLYNYGYLVKELILYHPWIIGQDTDNVGRPLLQFMIVVLEQKSLKTSSIALDFWKEFHEKVKSNLSIQPFILNNYNIVYQKLIQKTIRKYLPKQLIKDNQEVVYEDQTDDGEADDQKVTFEKYRYDSSFLYEVILAAFQTDPNGIELFFNKISSLLQSGNDCKIQLGLFIVFSSVTVLKDKPNDIIPQIIDYCSKCLNVNPNVKKHITKIFSQLSDEVRIYDRFEPVLITVLNYLTDSQVSEIASNTFDHLMISMPQHANITLVERMIRDCNQNLRKLNNIPLFTKILSGVLTLIQKLQDQQYSIAFLKQLLENSVSHFSAVLESQHQSLEHLEMSLSQAELYLIHFQKLAKQKHSSAIMATSYYTAILNTLFKSFEICKKFHIKYNSFNSLGLLTSIYCKIIKNIGSSQLENLDIVNISTSLSCVNPKENCELLKILITTIQQSIGSSLVILDDWLKQNLILFIQNYISLIQTTLDPDIIRNLYLVLDRVIKYNSLVFIYLPNNQKIIQTSLKIITGINQMMMSKCVLEFLLSAISIQNVNLQPIYQQILVSLLQSLQFLGVNGAILAAQIFIRILKGQNQQSLNNILIQIINQTAIKDIDRLDLVIEAVNFFIINADESNLKSAFVLFGSVLKGLGQNDIMSLEMKYKAAKKALKAKQ